MSATTITRPTLTDDSGNLTSGDVINAAFFNANVYDVIDGLYTRGTSVWSGSSNDVRLLRIVNLNATASTTTAATSIQVGNDAGVDRLTLQVFPSTRSGSTAYPADGVIVQSTGAAGLNLMAAHASGRLALFSGGVGLRGQVTAGGDFVWGTAALATSATAGFVWVPSCAGAPTGAPTAPYTNAAAVVVDTTNNRLYVLVGATWRYAALT
jgi:hypothetical protein